MSAGNKYTGIDKYELFHDAFNASTNFKSDGGVPLYGEDSLDSGTHLPPPRTSVILVAFAI